MKLNGRQIEVIRFLLNKNDYCTIDSISTVFDVSNRTLRNDIHVIECYLSDKGITCDISTGKGCRIIATYDQIGLLENDLNKEKVLSNKEYVEIIFSLLLLKNDYKYDSLAEYCELSKSKIISLMDDIEKKSILFGLNLIKEKGKGIYLEGEEISFRNAACKQIINGYIIKNLFSDSELEMANTAIKMIENKLNIQYYNRAIVELIISYSLHRISSGRLLDNGFEIDTNPLEGYPIGDFEKEYILYTLSSFKFHDKNTELEESEAKEIACYLAEELKSLHELNGDAKDKFITGLTTHLKVALYRIYNNLPIENVLANQVRITIPLIYEFTRTCLLACEEKYHICFEESEVAYIAMYVGSAYEKSIAVDTRVKVLLVCSFGMATSSILKTRIEQMMPDCYIEGPFCHEDALKYIKYNKADLAISTSFESLDNIPVIKVNPLLSLDEIDIIRNKLFQISYSKMCQTFLDSFGKKEKEVHYFKDLIEKDNIQIVDNANGWEEAIKLAAKPLLRKNLIEQRYVESMINAVNTLGTYMVLVNGCAFVHAGTDDGITQDCISFLNIKKSIVFGNINSKIVKNIIVLGIKNRESKNMLNVVNIFAKDENLELLKEDVTIEQILNMHD